MEQVDISGMLETAIVAARLAGQRAVEEIKYVKSLIKNDSEMVTDADTVCQKIIIDRIKESYPDHGFIAEEGPDGGIYKSPPRSEPQIWWVIDPIDGTNNYAKGVLSFAVSIAVINDGRPIVGVIFNPATESMYTAALNNDAQMNYSAIRTSEDKLDRFSCFGVDNHIKEDHEEGTLNIMRRCRFRNLGTTALHLAYVASGGFVGAVTTVPRLWDIAAGSLLVQNAGGIVTDLQGNDIFPIDLNNYDGSAMNILAANKKNHKLLLDLLNNTPENN